jgi:hypothetical protein
VAKTTPIPAIETRYNGYHFRSRIEARWAVFFDVAGIKYDYEPDKFETPHGRYIPDFWLPDLGEDDAEMLKPSGVFFEVKGADPSDVEIQKAEALAGVTNASVWLFFGSSFSTGYQVFPPMFRGIWGRRAIHSINQCPCCGRIGVSPDADATDSYRINTHICFAECEIAKRYNVLDHFNQDFAHTSSSPLLDLAREAAKSVRFEDASYIDQIRGLTLAGLRYRDHGVHCTPEVTGRIVGKAAEWRSEGDNGKLDFMRYDAPWWMRHKENLVGGNSPCDCYRCVAASERIANGKS